MSFRADFSGSSALVRFLQHTGLGLSSDGGAEAEASAESSAGQLPGAPVPADAIAGSGSRVLPLSPTPGGEGVSGEEQGGLVTTIPVPPSGSDIGLLLSVDMHGLI